MPTQELRDSRNRLIGRIKQCTNGKLEARDAKNRLCGTYNPRTNETRDANNRLVGRGNMLPALLVERNNQAGR